MTATAADPAAVPLHLAATPVYYRATLADGTPVQVWDVITAYGFTETYHLADALAYLLRAHRKGDAANDLVKARAHLARHDLLDLGDPIPLDEHISDAEDCPMSPAAIALAFGCEGAQAEAVRLLLEMALFECAREPDAETGEIVSAVAEVIAEIDVALVAIIGGRRGA